MQIKNGFTRDEYVKDALYMRKRKFAFTLAEVLITIGIIGIVAAMTMPSMIAKYQEKQTVTALKKVYSVLSQAYVLAKLEYGDPSSWYTTETRFTKEASINMGNKFTKYMKLSKTCHEREGCFPDIYKKIDGKNIPVTGYNVNTDISKYNTNDGMSIFFYSYGSVPFSLGEGSYNKSYGAILIDINGFKGPNTNGVDAFSFIVTKDGILPSGGQEMVDTNGFPNQCNRTDCKDTCEGCAAWVIYNENMDYLKCDDLSWEGKTKCK